MVSTYGDGWCDLSFMEIPVPDQYGPAFIFGEVSALTLAKAPFISAARSAASGGEVEQSGMLNSSLSSSLHRSPCPCLLLTSHHQAARHETSAQSDQTAGPAVAQPVAQRAASYGDGNSVLLSQA